MTTSLRGPTPPASAPGYSPPRVAITQPYVPEYRVPLFSRVVEQLRSEGVEARVFFGGSRRTLDEYRARGDWADVPWATQVPVTSVPVPGTSHRVMRRRLPRGWQDALLVTEMQAANGDALVAALRRRPFVTVGHGATYTAHENPLGMRIETWLNRRAAHVLTYMDAGRDEVLRRTGRHESVVTAFHNTIDTGRLRESMSGVTGTDLQEFRSRTGIPSDARVALVLATLTPDKRPDLIAEAAAQVMAQDPRAWLLVAGGGPGVSDLGGVAEQSGRVVFLGHVGPGEIATAARASSLLVNPGRIGLLAVDALTLGLPVLTTTVARHAPEAGYLVEGRDVVTVAPDELADAWTRALDRGLVAAGAGDDVAAPTIEAAADCIVHAIHQALVGT